jgi:ABC-type lipoprotein export system ATPase subunit
VEAGGRLRKVVRVAQDSSVEALAAGLATSQDLLARVVTASAQEQSNDADLAKETKTLADLNHQAAIVGEKLGHLGNAHGLLSELEEQNSTEELTARILAENAEEIARTFLSIHSPTEFDIHAEDDRMRIVRRRTKRSVDLEEMSSGQRAAFALSLFLAMNARLRSGPPVLLFDDPVAHVDDINALSFLDYLRDLAIAGTRQIFFATADTKFASLIRQKFRFLGPEGFNEIRLGR